MFIRENPGEGSLSKACLDIIRKTKKEEGDEERERHPIDCVVSNSH